MVVVRGELPCMSCAQAWRDAVRGDAVSPDGVAGPGPGAKNRGGARRVEGSGGGQNDLHIWNHFRSARALAMKGETGRLAGERGDRGLTLDIPQSGISEQENNRQQKVKRLKRKQKYPLFVFNVAYKKTPEVTLMNRLLHNDEHLNKSLNPSRS